jgi:hypothetical protein
LTGPASTRLHRTVIERMRTPLVATGTATEDELIQHLTDIDTRRLNIAAFPIVSGWGRKAP